MRIGEMWIFETEQGELAWANGLHVEIVRETDAATVDIAREAVGEAGPNKLFEVKAPSGQTLQAWETELRSGFEPRLGQLAVAWDDGNKVMRCGTFERHLSETASVVAVNVPGDSRSYHVDVVRSSLRRKVVL